MSLRTGIMKKGLDTLLYFKIPTFGTKKYNYSMDFFLKSEISQMRNKHCIIPLGKNRL